MFGAFKEEAVNPPSGWIPCFLVSDSLDQQIVNNISIAPSNLRPPVNVSVLILLLDRSVI